MIALETTSVIDQAGLISLEARRDTLATRLDTGFNMIEQAEREGQDVSRWDLAWERLLAEYEQVCDQIERRDLRRAS